MHPLLLSRRRLVQPSPSRRSDAALLHDIKSGVFREVDNEVGSRDYPPIGSNMAVSNLKL
jgi:hypothetical protein